MTTLLPQSFVSNDAFREIFQSMSEGIVMVEENGVIVTANPIAEQLFGYSQNELKGVVLEQLLPQRYRGRHVNLRASYNAHPEPKRMGIGRDLTALRKDGSEFPVEISLSYTHVDGRLLVMGFISDITQRKIAEDGLKRSEEQLIVYAAELEKKVESRTEVLNRTIKELEKEITERKKAEDEAQKALEKERELNDLKSKFVSIASHEFRTPLSTILSSISLVEQYKQRNELDKMDKHTERVRKSVKHLTSILNDFLSLGKLEEGKVDVIKEPINIVTLFNDIIEELKNNLKEGQRIEVSIDSNSSLMLTDGRILRNILFNLLSNASKYSETGKVIYISADAHGKSIVLAIRDEGIGIPAEDHRHLFARFFRAGNVSNIQGTGLGLHIVKRYVDLLDGTISFTSQQGKGTTFTVVLPTDITSH